jgi:transcriptional regulator with XRE-family HTH domain
MRKIENVVIYNRLLKRAREAASLSQDDLANLIGTNASTISGWERHEHQPSGYFREKLCAALGKSAAELGLLPPAEPIVGSSLFDPLIPFPIALIGRDEQLARLRQQLLVSRMTFTVLLGLPGIGKTAMAAALTYDQRVQRHFQDGILWIGLGPEPNIAGLLSRWGKLLGLSRNEMAELHTKEVWINTLRSAIGERSMLLVIDDAWSLEDVLACCVGGLNCTYLLSTRFPEIAARITINGMTRVEELTTQDGMVLLRTLAPSIVEQERSKAVALVEAVGGLPLALTLMGNYLRKEGYSGHSRRIQAALRRLSDVKGRLLLSEPRTPIDSYRWLPEGKTLSLQAIIAVADQHLTKEARQTLYALSVLPRKPDSFSEEAVLAVTATTVETIDLLMDAGLLESSSDERYTLHQTIADYAHIHMKEQTAYERLIAYVVRVVEQRQTDHEWLEKECSMILAALEAAYALQKHTELARTVTAFTPFLLLRNMDTLAYRHVQRMLEAAMELQDNESTARALHYQEELKRRQE